jgi:tetratricopeptide (TPR) repeat protein
MAAEHLLIDFALRGADGNKTAAARTLGISRKAVERRLHGRDGRRDCADSCLKQGQALVDGADFRKAIDVLTRGLRRLDRRPPRDDGRRLRFQLRRLLALSHRAVGGWRSTEARACYAAALDDARALGETAPLTSLLFGIWTTQLMALELNEARATAQEMLERAQTGGDGDALAHAYLALANTLFWLGDNREALACLTRGRLLDAAAPPLASSQGLDLAGLAVMIEGLCAFQLGEFGRARKAGRMLAARGAASSAHPFHRAIALQGAAWLACLCEDTEQLGSLALALEQLCAQHGFVFYQGVGQVFRGCHLLSSGQPADGERAMAEGYERHMLCEGGLLFHSFHAWKRGEALLRAGRAEDCERLVAAALEIALERHERAYLGEMLDVFARARLAMGDLPGAERELRNALSSAVALGSAAGGVGVATHLAQLLAHTGRRPEAKEVLLRALRGVEPDMALPRLSRAMQLLRELEGTIFHVISD